MKNKWVPIALLAAVLLGVALYFLSQGNDSDPARSPTTGQQCSDDKACGSAEVCCGTVCKAAAECSPEAREANNAKNDPAAKAAKKAALQFPDAKLPFKPREPVTKDLGPNKCEEKTDCTGTLQECDEETQNCIEPFICLTDQDCNQGKFCQRGQCVDKVEGCRFIDCYPQGFCNTEYDECEKFKCKTHEDCAGQRKCDPELQFCVTCVTDDHCPPNNKCMKSGYCLPPDGCMGDGNCEGDSLCDVRTSTCTDAPCVPDSQEPNNKWHNAKTIEPGEYTYNSCYGDNDWFKFELAKGEGFIAHAFLDRDVGLVDLRLHDINGVEIHRGMDTKMEGDFAVTWTKAEKDTILYLNVKHISGLHVPYDLRFTILSEGFCEDDKYEPNNHVGEATTLNDRVRWNFNLCPGNDDWILQSLEAGQTLKLLVGTVKGDVPRVEVFRDEEKEPMWKDNSSEPEKVLIYKSERAADFYIRVSPIWKGSISRYDVRIDLEN